jgi:hypothetical protein
MSERAGCFGPVKNARPACFSRHGNETSGPVVSGAAGHATASKATRPPLHWGEMALEGNFIRIVLRTGPDAVRRAVPSIPADVCARLGGDEFAILSTCTSEP